MPQTPIGTSAGALNGAFISTRPQTVQTADALGSIWRSLKRGQVFPLNPLTGLLGFAGARDHLVPDSGLRRLVTSHVEHERLEDMPLPFHVVAVDAMTGEELLLSSGPAVEAVMASAAIPAVLPPVPWGRRRLIDGGVANNTPISHAIALGAREIYVLPTGHACALEKPPGSALALALQALRLLVHHRLIDDIEKHRDDAHLVVLPPPCPLSVTPIEFGYADDLIRLAYADAREFLDAGGAELPALRMRMHRHARRASAAAPRRRAA